MSFIAEASFSLIKLSGDRWLVINPMLTGALQYCGAQERVRKKTCVILALSSGKELRYLDERQMGMVYYVKQEQIAQVPRLNEQGPDVLEGISFEEFQHRLRRFHGEIKGVLTRGAFISGIGNAYSDEILFAAGLSPFRKSRVAGRGGGAHSVREVPGGSRGRPRGSYESAWARRFTSRYATSSRYTLREASPVPDAAEQLRSSPPTSASRAIAVGVSRECSLRTDGRGSRPSTACHAAISP